MKTHISYFIGSPRGKKNISPYQALKQYSDVEVGWGSLVFCNNYFQKPQNSYFLQLDVLFGQTFFFLTLWKLLIDLNFKNEYICV